MTLSRIFGWRGLRAVVVGSVLLIGLGASPQSWATGANGELTYSIAALSPLLLKGAASVVRRYDVTLTLERPDRYTYSVHRVVTILGPGAASEAQLAVMSSSLRKITDISARLYDAAGVPGRRLRGPDWRDVSATDAGTFLDDSRARIADARQPSYPYTVELTYEVTSTNPLYLPEWQPQHDWAQSVESATFRLQHPAALPVRWREWRLPPGAARPDTVTAGLTQHRWTVRNLLALHEAPYAPPLGEQAAAVWCAPTTFEVQGFAGDQRSWTGFGKWWNQLNAGRDELPPALQAEMAALRDSVADPRRRAQRVYERVQRTTRYVSVQLGLGGWQTIPAAEVARTGYGDCKALTTYCRALLGAAGLPAYPALVAAGDDAPDVHPEWVAPQFNHVILCVPLGVPLGVPLAAAKTSKPGAPADTVWLECTSGTRPFNSLGDFTANRHVLLVTPEGGRIVRTPSLDATTTTRSRHATLRLASTGAATATVRTRRTGPLGDAYARLLPLGAAEQRRIITESLPTTTQLTLTNVRLTAAPATATGAVVQEDLELTLPAAAARAGTRLRLPLNMLGRWVAPRPDSARTAALWLTEATTFTDTVVVQLPPGARAEAVPAAVEVKSAFGT